MRRRLLAVVAAFLACLIAGHVGAAPIAVTNPSFEANVLGDGGFTPTITGWTKSVADSNAGTFNPTAGLYPPSGVLPHGVNVAFSSGPLISQPLATNLAANTFYTLTTAIGTRQDGAAPTSHAVQLWAGATQVAQGIGAVPTVGTFVTATASYYAPVGDSLAGQPLEIRLVKTGGSQANFDDVVLDATPALTLQNPTALYSQNTFPIAEAIDNDLTQTSGWAGAVGVTNPTPANIGVFETQTDVGYLSGTLLTVRLDQ